jgi:hypothetical protein
LYPRYQCNRVVNRIGIRASQTVPDGRQRRTLPRADPLSTSLQSIE